MNFFRLISSFLQAIVPLASANADHFAKNEQVREVLRQNGDRGMSPRVVQHYAYFHNGLGRGDDLTD
jgi:hypothetical protein